MMKEKKFINSPVELHINRKYYFQLRKVKKILEPLTP